LQLSSLEKELKPLNETIVNLWVDYKKWMEEKSGVDTELEREYQDVKNLKKEIDDLYKQKQDIFNNKDLSFSQKKKLHIEIDSQIETLKTFRAEQFSDINKSLSAFYQTEVKDKISKDKLQQEKHEDYLNKIAAAQTNYDNKEAQVV
jgi:chromosome segregation ATPase